MTRKSLRYLTASQLDKAYLCHLQVQGSSDPFQATRATLCWDPEQPYAGIQSSPVLGSRAAPSLPASVLLIQTQSHPRKAQMLNLIIPVVTAPGIKKRGGTPVDHGWAWDSVTSAYLLGLLPFETPAQPAHGPLAGK